MARLLFTRRGNLASGLIRAVTWSAWSHVQILNDQTLWGASFPHGVGREDLTHRLSLSSRAAMVAIPAPSEGAVLAFLEAQEGKPYDGLGAFGLGLHRDWRRDDAWWCSELAAAAIEAGGTRLFRAGSVHRVTPQHLFMLPFEAEHLK